MESAWSPATATFQICRSCISRTAQVKLPNELRYLLRNVFRHALGFANEADMYVASEALGAIPLALYVHWWLNGGFNLGRGSL